jgi:hypothetical protein
LELDNARGLSDHGARNCAADYCSGKEIVMKKHIAASLFGLALVASSAMLPSAAEAGSRYYPEEAILDWSGERFTLVRIDSFEPTDDERLRLESWMQGSADQIDALQNTVEENGEFAAALLARSVQLNNVVAIQRALNGNLVVYLR